MPLKDKTVLELSTPHPYINDYIYSELILPANNAQIEDAIQKVRGIGREEYMQISVISCPRLPELTDTRLDCPTIKELNFFAKRIEALPMTQVMAMNVLFETQKEAGEYENGVSMKELINMTYGLDAMTVVGGIRNDKELGEMIKANEMEPYMYKLSDEMIEMLDAEKVGKKFREGESGVFKNDYYIARLGYQWPKVYDGETLPNEFEEDTEMGDIRIKITHQPYEGMDKAHEDAIWVSLPLSEPEMKSIAERFGEENIQNCVVFQVESTIPKLDLELFAYTKDFSGFNELAKEYAELKVEDKIKFKALMYINEPENAIEAIDLLKNLPRYELSYYSDTTVAYATEYLSKMLPTNFDMDVFTNNGLSVIGNRILEHIGASMTEYGVISDKDIRLFDVITVKQEEQCQDEETEQEMGGMQM